MLTDWFLPDWAPNIHPLIVHFPIALILTAVGVNLLALVFRRTGWLRELTALLFILGGISALVTYFSGRQAADLVTLPAAANPVLSRHADLALITVIYFGFLAVVHAFLWWRRIAVAAWLAWLLFVLAAAGSSLIVFTGDRGAKLVYYYGVGVHQAEPEAPPPAAPATFHLSDDGSWEWTPAMPGTPEFPGVFRWMEGDARTVSLSRYGDEQGIAVAPEQPPGMWVAGPAIEDIQVTARVNLDLFDGVLFLVHHVQDKENYDFLALSRSDMRLGRMVAGKARIFQEKPVDFQGWVTLRVVGAGRHFRGYLNDKLVTHGHQSALPAGSAGLRLEGSGKLGIRQLTAQVLAEEDH
jgi:uncharacterized membrane protein